MRIHLVTLTALAFAMASAPGLAAERTVPSDISQEQFAKNCEAGGGYLIEGQTASGCDLPSGTQVVCSFDAGEDGTQNTLCEIDGRPATEGLLADLLGGVLPNRMGPVVGESLTSSSGGTQTATSVGSSGRGPAASGAGTGPGTVGGSTGPTVK